MILCLYPLLVTLIYSKKWTIDAQNWITCSTESACHASHFLFSFLVLIIPGPKFFLLITGTHSLFLFYFSWIINSILLVLELYALLLVQCKNCICGFIFLVVCLFYNRIFCTLWTVLNIWLKNGAVWLKRTWYSFWIRKT